MTLSSLVRQLIEAKEPLTEYIVYHGPVHFYGCPGDDTCDCPHKPKNDAANLAVNASPALAEAMERLERYVDLLEHNSKGRVYNSGKQVLKVVATDLRAILGDTLASTPQPAKPGDGR